MANINSDLATKQAAAKQDHSAGIIHGDDAMGIILFATAKVTVPSTAAVDDTLTLVPAEACPVGAVVIPQLSHVYCVTDPGTALTLDIGTAADPDKFSDALALTTAGTTGGAVSFSASGTAPAAIATPYRFSEQEAILATVKVATSLNETVIVFTIAYRAKA